MKCLLVAPRFVQKVGTYYNFPLGIAYVSAALKRAGHEVHCLNLNNLEGAADELVREAVRRLDPDMLGSGGLSPYFAGIRDIFAAGRAAKRDIVNVVGGGVFSCDPETVAGLLDIDTGVIGEGEETVIELAAALDGERPLDSVAGLLHRRRDGTAARTAARAAIRDLDGLAWPDWEGFGIEQFLSYQNIADDYFLHGRDDARAMPMIASRSCPYGCTFCFHPLGRTYRQRGLDDVFAELDDSIARYGINMVAILDELFAVKKDRLMAFCERIKPYGIQWMVQLHVSACDAPTIRCMRDAGCTYISLGLESMSETVLRSMAKKATPVAIDRALSLTRGSRIGIQGNFIFGDPAETPETISETFDWWARNRDYQVNLSLMVPYPGTPLYHDGLKSGRIPDKANHFLQPLANLTAMSDDTVSRLQRHVLIERETLLLPAELLAFEPEGTSHPTRGPLYRVRWKCRDCGHDNDYRGVAVDNEHQFQSFRFTCRACAGRFDMPNLARPRWSSPEAETQYRQARALYEAAAASGGAQRWRETMAAYGELIRLRVPPGSQDRPEPWVRAHLDLGMIYLDHLPRPALAVAHLAQVLYRRAYDPACHVAYARALFADGMPHAAALHFEQAARLLAASAESVPQANALRRTAASLRTARPAVYFRGEVTHGPADPAVTEPLHDVPLALDYA